jgi:hypothetical protein
MVAERRRIVNRLGLPTNESFATRTSRRLSGERRDQTVDQASELAAGIVVGLTSMMIKPSSLPLARKLQTGEEGAVASAASEPRAGRLSS